MRTESQEESRGASSRRQRAPKAVAGVKGGRENSGKDWKAKEIVWRKPADLKPHPSNPKVHPPEQLRALGEAFKAFGFDQPVLVDELDTILKGHGRTEAAGAEYANLELVPTIVRDGLTDAQKLALVISDNQLPLLGSFDQKLLRAGLTQLVTENFPVKLLGFTDVRLATFIGGEQAAGNTEPNEQVELQEKAVSKRGDVWQLGQHVLHCRSSEDFEQENVRLHLSDPPYELDGVGGGIQAKRDYPDKIIAAGIDKFDVANLRNFGKTRVFFTSKKLIPNYIQLAVDLDLPWDLNFMHRANAMPNTAAHLMTDIDYIVVMGAMHPNRGLEHTNYSKMLSLGHWERPVPWAKPVEVLTKYIRLFSTPGDTVFDGYCGSGSTIIACGMEGRSCVGVEINPLFVDVAVRRWQKWSGKSATLAGTKKTFDQIERERTKKKPG